MVRLLIAISLVCACTRKSEKYCGLHPEDLANCGYLDAGIDAPSPCNDDSQCTPPSPRCFLGTTPGVCVGCLSNDDCREPGKQSCDLETLTCRSCLAHDDCPSKACLPNGTCGDDSNTIFVTVGGNGDCTSASPCGTITDGLSKVVPMVRFHMKLVGTFAGPLTIANKRVVMLAGPMTRLAGGDPTLKLETATVTIHDLEISGVNCIRTESQSTLFLDEVLVHTCSKVGLEAKDGFLQVQRSRITTCLDGAVWLQPTTRFEITNTLIYKNGNDAAAKGAVTIERLGTDMASRFEHNTVADNRAKYAATVSAGISCTATNFMELRNNIIAGNTTTTGVNNNAFGGCDITGSLVTDDTIPLAFTADYHLGPTSSAIDKVDSTIADDVDGQFRPQGTRKDYGADEYKP